MDSVFIDLGCWLGKIKLDLMKSNNESISTANVVARIIIEKVALLLIQCADIEDQARRLNKDAVTAFYSAGTLLDACLAFGEMNENMAQHKEYAKSRAAHLLECLSTSEKPSDPTTPKLDTIILNRSENPSQELSLLPMSTINTNFQNFTSPLSSDESLVSPNTSIAIKNLFEPMEQAQRFCKNASKALERKDITSARKSLTSAIVLFKKQKIDERNISDSITPVEGAQKLCRYASCSLVTYKDFPSASKYFRNAIRVLSVVKKAEGSLEDSSAKLEKIRQRRFEESNDWTPKRLSKIKGENPEETNSKDIMETILGILNRLTPSNAHKLLRKIQTIHIDTEDGLADVTKLFFEKAANEPQYANLYALMCQALSAKEVVSSKNPAKTTNFRKLLLTRCQREFEKNSAGLVDVESLKKNIGDCNDINFCLDAKKNEMKDDLVNFSSKLRKQYLGNITFIGELFKLRFLSVKIMHQCIVRLLAQPDDEESLESLCRLLTTIGKDLEPSGARSASSSSRETINSYFSTLDTIVNKRKISNQIRFMIQDVVDLRENQWKPHCKDNNIPTTIDKIRKEVKREEQERELSYQSKNNAQASQSNWRRKGTDYAYSGERNASGFFTSKSMTGVCSPHHPLPSPQQQLYSSPGARCIKAPCYLPPGSAVQFQPRATQATYGSFRQASPYSPYPLPRAPVMCLPQQSSQENSATLPQREAAQHAPLVHEPSKDLLQGLSTVTEDQIARKAHSVLEEFFTNESMDNAVLDLKEWLHASTVSTFINECLMHVLERNRKERKGTGTLLKEMVKRKLFTTPQVLKGFELVLQTAEDFLVDIPKLWEYLAQMVEPIFEDGVVNIGFLGELAEILSPAMAPSFVAATLKELVNAPDGIAELERLWNLSNTPFSSILPGVNLNAFINQHKILEFLLKYGDCKESPVS